MIDERTGCCPWSRRRGLCLSEAAITGPPLHTHAYRELFYVLEGAAALEEFFEEFGVPIAQPVVG